MSRTSFEIIYDLKDTTALEDSTPSTLDNQSFAEEILLKEGTEFLDYGTLEQDYFVLDESMPEMPDELEGVPFWCSSISDENGSFESNPLLTILFTQSHTSVGVTFHFVGDVPLLIQVRWYDLNGNMISVKSYEPDSKDYFARNLIENFGRIEIEFQKTKSYRYVKLWGLDYGTELLWGEDQIKKGSLTEETDPTSNTLKVNKLSFQLVDPDNEFNLANTDGIHKALQKKQHITPYEIVEGERISLGRYFLDSFSTDKGVVKMDATDYINMLDDTDFKNGRVYDGDLAGDVIAEIFEETNIPYEVIDEVAKIPLYGWLKIQSRRKALREVLFACGAVAETARREDILICKPSRDVQNNIRRSRKFATKATQDTYISEVSIKFAEYTASTEEKELVKEATYSVGLNEVKFNSPVSDLRISVGEIVEAHTNYLIFYLAEETAVTIYGRQYSKMDLTVTSDVGTLKAGEKAKNKSFSGTLLNYQRAKEISDAILEYYQLSLVLDIKYLAGNECPGQWAEVENTLRGHVNYVAGMESIKTDLTGGYISTAKLRGYYKDTSEHYYTGTELYTGTIGVL